MAPTAPHADLHVTLPGRVVKGHVSREFTTTGVQASVPSSAGERSAAPKRQLPARDLFETCRLPPDLSWDRSCLADPGHGGLPICPMAMMYGFAMDDARSKSALAVSGLSGQTIRCVDIRKVLCPVVVVSQTQKLFPPTTLSDRPYHSLGTNRLRGGGIVLQACCSAVSCGCTALCVE